MSWKIFRQGCLPKIFISHGKFYLIIVINGVKQPFMLLESCKKIVNQINMYLRLLFIYILWLNTVTFTLPSSVGIKYGKQLNLLECRCVSVILHSSGYIHNSILVPTTTPSCSHLHCFPLFSRIFKICDNF